MHKVRQIKKQISIYIVLDYNIEDESIGKNTYKPGKI